jgi:enamine deaminase RidA (YjgF/YER057c/UK114 family)
MFNRTIKSKWLNGTSPLFLALKNKNMEKQLSIQSAASMSSGMTPESRLKGLGFDVNTIPLSQPKGNYVSCVKTGSLLHIAGHLPYNPKNGEAVFGKVGDKYTVDEAKTFAKWAALRILRTISNELGNLSRVKRIVKLNGFVNCTDDFIDHPKVLNGASDFLVQVFGTDIGLHSRTAIGCISLPFNVPVEIDMVVEVSD